MGQHTLYPELKLPSHGSGVAMTKHMSEETVSFNIGSNEKHLATEHILSSFHYRPTSFGSEAAGNLQGNKDIENFEDVVGNQLAIPLVVNTRVTNRANEEESNNIKMSSRGRIVANPIHQLPIYSIQSSREHKIDHQSDDKENAMFQPSAVEINQNNKVQPTNSFQKVMSQLQEAHNQITILGRKSITKCSESIEHDHLQVDNNPSGNTDNKIKNVSSLLNGAEPHDTELENSEFDLNQDLSRESEANSQNFQPTAADTIQEDLQSKEEFDSLEGIECIFK